MEIKTGLFDRMVLQRDRSNRCDASIAGVCAQAGIVTAAAARNGRSLPGFKARAIGRARGGKFAGRLRGLPAGGPYAIVLAIRSPAGAVLEEITIADVLVGDVWVLAGQSNMEGIGRLRDAMKPHPLVRAMYMNDEWGVARDPIHVLAESVDAVHSGWPDSRTPRARAPRGRPNGVGVGPAMSFGREMLRQTGVPQGLLACAHGGSSMEQWDPARKRLGSRSLYGAMLRRFVKSGGQAAGMLWYQGESDAQEKSAGQYTRRMKRLVAAVRRDFRQPRLPWAIVQLAGVYNWQPDRAVFWNQIQEQQRCLPRLIKNLLTVPAIDLALDDSIHVAGREMVRLGRRLAQAMLILRREPARGLPPIELGGISFERDRKHNCAHVVLTFKHVAGQLQAAGRPAGFTLADPSGMEYAYRVELRKQAVVLRATALHAGMVLHYGRGLAPCCNITDGADRSLPVFGPLPLNTPQLRRRMLRDLRTLNVGQAPALAGNFADRALVSRPLPAPADIRKLPLPANFRRLGLKLRKFPGGFWDLHRDEFNCAPRDLMVYFVCRLVCAKAARINLGVGYDGPVKIWINGRAVYCDRKGANPAGVDKALIPFQAGQGRHTVVFALASNHGRAWGIKFRCLRRAARPSGQLPSDKLPFLKITA